jgi:hypothetical protein
MPPPSPKNAAAIGGPTLLVAAHVLLLWLHDLASHPWWTLGALLLAFAGLGWAVFGAGRLRFDAPLILGVALVLRTLLLPLPATLSDDVLRYLWDGKVAVAGFNPYALAPDAVELSELRDESWRVMPHREVEAVYPPLALAFFSIAAALPKSLLVWKLLLVVSELFGCALLLRLAASLDIEPRRVALYAWNPLVTLEVAGMGHVDGLGVALVIATVWALVAGRRWAAVTAAASVLAKLVPLLALPVWARHAPRAAPFVALALALAALGLLPAFAATGGVPPGWVRFGVSWEFNGPLYEPLWRAIDGLGLDSGFKSVLDLAKASTGAHDFWNRFYPLVYPQLMAKAVLGALLAALLWRIWRDRRAPIATATGRSFAALVLCSATVYPWYLLWVLPWAALALQRAWLALSALVLLSYLPQVTALRLMPGVFAAIWVPFAVLLWSDRSWSID